MTVIKFGLVGAGPWANMVYGPTLSAGPETRLAAIWARRPDAAAELAGKYGGKVCGDFDELLSSCDAVAFSVPPMVQAVLALKAVEAGKSVILEKPIADTLDNAERLAEAIERKGVTSVVTLTYRFAQGVRDFVAEAKTKKFRGGRALFLTNAYLGGPFATDWRLSGGSIIDIGPHAIDIMEKLFGSVKNVSAVHGLGQWTAVTLEHADGAVSQISLCSHTDTDPLRFEVDLYGEEGTANLDVIGAMGPIFGEALMSGRQPLGAAEAFTTLRTEFAEAMRTGRRHPLDASHGLHVQRLVDLAQRSLSARRSSRSRVV
jgi:predicted dehydrogenase